MYKFKILKQNNNLS